MPVQQPDEAIAHLPGIATTKNWIYKQYYELIFCDINEKQTDQHVTGLNGDFFATFYIMLTDPAPTHQNSHNSYNSSARTSDPVGYASFSI